MIGSRMCGRLRGHCPFDRGPLKQKTGQAVVPLLALIAVIHARPQILLADVIHLKNGRRIVADTTHEDAKVVIYQRGGGEFTIPRSLVERVEKTVEPPTEPGPNEERKPHKLLLPATPSVELQPDIQSQVLKDNAVDEAFLQQLDKEVASNPSSENLHRLAQAYQAAAIFLTQRGEPERAIAKYRHALTLAPNDLALTLALGYLLTTQHRPAEAVSLLELASSHHPDSPDVAVLLGSAYYAMENLDRAVLEWRKALSTRDEPRLREALDKAERERGATVAYRERRSPHFLLRYEGRQVNGLSADVLNALEGSFRELAQELDYYPAEIIVVLLYPDQAFRDVTRSPAWVGAVNDGKIRVPISGLTAMTPELARVLKHELTHSFVRLMTLGRCPTWFNEGLAQLVEGATTATAGRYLAQGWAAGQTPPFPALETSFVSLPPEEAGLAYLKSLAALEYLRDTFGMAGIRRLLKAMPTQSNFNSLLQGQLRLSYPALEAEVAGYLAKRYGP